MQGDIGGVRAGDDCVPAHPTAAQLARGKEEDVAKEPRAATAAMPTKSANLAET